MTYETDLTQANALITKATGNAKTIISSLTTENTNLKAENAALKTKIDELTKASTSPQKYPDKVVSMYHMMWNNTSIPRLSTIPTTVNVLALAFYQWSGLVGYASEGSWATLKAETDKLRQRGVRIVLSIGGEAGSVNTSDTATFVKNVMYINDNLVTLDGIDWDIEASALSTNDVLTICRSLRAARGANFAITMAPNGSNISQYIETAKALNAEGLLNGFGQQFYGAVVSQNDMMWRIYQYVEAGLPINKYQIGNMVEPSTDAKTWTVQQCVDNFKAAKLKYPTIAGCYLWHSGTPYAFDWAAKVATEVYK